LDLDAKFAENASDGQFVCRYGYTIIRLCDVRFSLQAVIVAFLVLLFGKLVRKRDIKVKLVETVAKERSGLLQKCLEIHKDTNGACRMFGNVSTRKRPGT
jgi:hypothetical protein